MAENIRRRFMDGKNNSRAMNRCSGCIILVLVASLMQGCSSQARILDNIRYSISLKSTNCSSIDWSAVTDDYDREMFKVVSIEFGTEIVNLLGFRPSIVYSFVNKDIGLEGLVLNVGSSNRTGLYLYRNDKGTYLLEAGSSLPLEYDYYLTQWELYSSLARSEGLRKPVSRGIVYVERRFWEEVCDKVKFPDCFKPVMIASLTLDKETRFRSLKSVDIERESLPPPSKQ